MVQSSISKVVAESSDLVAPDRRALLRAGGTGSLSVVAIALLGGVTLPQGAFAQSKADIESDVSILNVALGLEHEAISAYQLGAGSGLLKKPVLDVAILFQSHHKGHRDALIATIQKLGGQAIAAKSDEEVAKALNAAALKTQEDVLRLAARLELGAANAYLGVIPSFKDGPLKQVSARLAADETMHWTALSQVLGQALPTAPLTFGA